MQTIAVEHSSTKQAQVFKIEWNMGKRCNFNCSYCAEFTHDNSSKHLPYEVAKKTVDKILEKTRGKKIKINLTGGEPTVNPEIEKIVDYMYSKGIDVGITTNGSRKLDFYERILPKLASLIFSYHMEYHGREVLPENIVSLYNLAQQQDHYIHVHVHMMMLPTQFDEAKTAIEHFKNNNVPVVMRRIRPAYKKDETAVYNEQGKLVEGNIARPFYDGTVTLKFKGKNVDYSGGQDYYSNEEIAYLETNNV